MNNGMTIIVKTITRLLLPFIIVFAAVITLYGHISPGGGFAGGAILACGLILLLIAFGRREILAGTLKEKASTWDCIGALAFLAIALMGYFGGTFFLNCIEKGDVFRLFSSGTIIWSNLAICVKVGASLFAVYAVLAMFRLSEEDK